MAARNWREVVREAFLESLKDAARPEDIVDELPEALHRALRYYGYAIHKSDLCIRLPWEIGEMGRLMTPEEMEKLGLEPKEAPIDV